MTSALPENETPAPPALPLAAAQRRGALRIPIARRSLPGRRQRQGAPPRQEQPCHDGGDGPPGGLAPAVGAVQEACVHGAEAAGAHGHASAPSPG